MPGDVERILHVLGISTTEAINLFLNRVRLSKGIPFPVQMSDDEFRNLPQKPLQPKGAASLSNRVCELNQHIRQGRSTS